MRIARVVVLFRRTGPGTAGPDTAATGQAAPSPAATGMAVRRPAVLVSAVLAVAALGIAGCGPQGQGADRNGPAAGYGQAGSGVTVYGNGHGQGHRQGQGHERQADGGHADHGFGSDLAADEPVGFSIYHAASVWTDQTGRERAIASLEGRVQVVGMVYTSCAYACPRMVLDMKRIEAELGPDLMDRVGFVLVSIDPERDTPEQLGRFATGSRLDPDRWTLLHGDDGDILELAALLGVQYRRMADGEFVHSNLLTVLDNDGRVVHRQLGLGADPAATLSVIRSLVG